MVDISSSKVLAEKVVKWHQTGFVISLAWMVLQSFAVDLSVTQPQGQWHDVLSVIAWMDDGEVMGLRHTGFADAVRIEGVQFYSDSILAEHGHAMLRNFLT